MASQILSPRLRASAVNPRANLSQGRVGLAVLNGQFVNFDPNWQPSGDTTTDCIYLRDRMTDLYSIEAR